jgi:hypothetical protein
VFDNRLADAFLAQGLLSLASVASRRVPGPNDTFAPVSMTGTGDNLFGVFMSLIPVLALDEVVASSTP